MIPTTITAKIFSSLGNSSSLLPLGIKDAGHSLGMTTGSYITGDKVEGKDRFIDEFGAEAIWLGGIPAYKKLIDWTLYKVAKYNPKIDIRILKNKEILEKAKHYAPENLKSSFEKVANNQKMFKGLFMAKFIAATALTLGSYSALTHFRHKQTEKEVMKELVKEEQQKNLSFNALNKTEVKKSKFGPAFGMNFSKGISDFMFNPVKNMMIVDGGITGDRLAESRSPQDFMGYVVKEGSFWMFMYFAGDKIQSFFENRAKSKHNKSIDLDIRVLQNDELKKSFETKQVDGHLADFAKNKTDVEIYKFVNEHPENLVVKMAKESGIISTLDESNNFIKKVASKLGIGSKPKKTEAVDTQKYIELADVKSVHDKIEKLHNEFKEANLKGETVDTFLKQATKLKRFAIMKNIGACVGVLGVVVPGIMVAIRLAKKDNKEFQVKKAVKEKLMAQNFQGVV